MIVEGPTASGLNMRMGYSPFARAGGQQSVSSISPTSPLPFTSASHGPPIFHCVVAPKKTPASLIKIMKAKMTTAKRGGKPDFQCIGQMYLELTEAVANVGHVREAVRGQWGSEYTVLSVEGLEIDNSLATQGQ